MLVLVVLTAPLRMYSPLWTLLHLLTCTKGCRGLLAKVPQQ
jgi:hypothetical protein